MKGMSLRTKKDLILEYLFDNPNKICGPTELGEKALGAPRGQGPPKSQAAIWSLYADGEIERYDGGFYQLSKKRRKELSLVK